MALDLAGVLVDRAVLTPEQLSEAESVREDGEPLAEALLRLKLASARELADALAALTGLERVELVGFTPSSEVMGVVPTRFVFRCQAIPLSDEGGRLRVAVADPFCLSDLDELRLLTGREVEPCVAARDELEDALHRVYGVGADALDRAADEGVTTVSVDESEGDLDSDDDAALIQFVNRLLMDAVQARASDIHIEPTQDQLQVRYRVDGVLQNAALPRELKRFQAAIVSRIKIMSKLDIAEKRLPQDGRIRLRSSGRELDVRVSVIPTIYGEGVALRLLDSGGGKTSGLSLEQTGMDRHHADLFRSFLGLPHGVVLVTGPTGSGKSTSLYAGLQEIDREALKVITVEDPVEYRLSGIMQIQVQEKIGLTFARGLRHILRHDPDVVMIGEIRDTETAEISVQAALTGHLVLSTLHTNDAAGAIPRLVDMGVEPYLVAATVEGLMAQRLVRRVCPECQGPVEVTSEDRTLLEDLELTDLPELIRGAGCETCAQRGYFGRTAIYEMIEVDDALRELAAHGASAVKLRNHARERGAGSLRKDGVRLIRAGRTTPEEVLRVTRAE